MAVLHTRHPNLVAPPLQDPSYKIVILRRKRHGLKGQFER
jgi:hypothetical protein